VAEFLRVWQRIVELQGQTFHQKTGRPFTYTVTGGSVIPSTTNRLLAKSQFARAYERAPLRGPRQLQDLQGPSYLYAILTDPRVPAADPRAPESRSPVDEEPAHRSPSGRFEADHQARSEPAGAARNVDHAGPAEGAVPPLQLGHLASPEELPGLGFRPLELQIGRTDVQLPGGTGCEWTAVGDVPDAPGLYTFTLELRGEDGLRVVYVGMTEHLWMVTMGHLPRGGGARGGQRYGRPTYAGVTRQRINIEVRRARQDGWIVRQWVRPFPSLIGAHEQVRLVLGREEESLISRWELRRDGWNRG
jgi:hypothetical protein